MRSPDLAFNGIVLSKKKYSNSSFICDIFSARFGKITLLAKGVRKANSKTPGIMQTGAELSLETHHKSESNWYIMKNAALINLYETSSFENSVYLQAALEMYQQLIIEPDDFEKYFSLLKDYLGYVAPLKQNAVAVFWRFLLRIMFYNGIPLNLNKCSTCSETLQNIFCYSNKSHGFICSECQKKLHPQDLLCLNLKESALIKIIPEIGNHLQDKKISSHLAKRITQVFIMHLNQNYDHHFKLKSLSLL